MSATGRSDVRQEGDYYRTPDWCVQALDRFLGPAYPIDYIVDPGCGDGAICSVLKNYGLSKTARNASYIGVEINPILAEKARATGAYDQVITGDFLSYDFHLPTPEAALYAKRHARIMTAGNPPFNQALEFVNRSLNFCTHVALLLRLNWAASAERESFHRAYPADLKVMSSRPSFMTSAKCGSVSRKVRGCGRKWQAPSKSRWPCPVCGNKNNTYTDTDATDYAWWLWGFSEGGHWEVV